MTVLVNVPLCTVQQNGIMPSDRCGRHQSVCKKTGTLEWSVDVHALLCVKRNPMPTFKQSHDACISTSLWNKCGTVKCWIYRVMKQACRMYHRSGFEVFALDCECPTLLVHRPEYTISVWSTLHQADRDHCTKVLAFHRLGLCFLNNIQKPITVFDYLNEYLSTVGLKCLWSLIFEAFFRGFFSPWFSSPRFGRTSQGLSRSTSEALPVTSWL